MVDSTLRFHGHIASIVSKASGHSVNLLQSTLSRLSDFLVCLFVPHIRVLLEFASPIWNTGYLGDFRNTWATFAFLDQFTERWTKNTDGMEELSYADRLRVLDLGVVC